MTTLLTVIADAVRETGAIAVPTAVVASADKTVLRFLALSKREGRELVRVAPWTVLQRLATITTADGTAEYAVPADFDRLLPDTEWDRTNYRPMAGSVSAEEWEVLKSGLIGSGVVGRRFRIAKSVSSTSRVITIDPTPTSIDTLVYWYVSAYYSSNAAGTAQAEWAADDDLLIVDRDLMTLGTILRFKRAVGLEYASEADEYAAILARTMAQDRPARTLNLVPSAARLIGWENIPETGLTG